ncbi:hypothetical protein [Parafilimonas sp.]|uniref:hypothetical protein n=1 Tax=Parafilimonas sp. TaxID=1969739 RepID=UPI003F7F7F75
MKLLFALLVTIAANAQHKELPAYGIYKSGDNYATHILSNSFSEKNSHHKLRNTSTHRVYVKNNNASVSYKYADIWGIRTKGTDWRIFNNKLYKVVYAGKAYVYIRPTRNDFTQPGITKFQTTWFSVTANGPLYELTRNNLLSAYSSNAALVSKVSSMKENKVVNRKDKTTGEYEFISWL